MPNINTMIEGKFLRKEDVGGESGIIVTIAGWKQENVAMQGADPEMKWTLTFEELDKPLVMNSTNLHMCAKACDSDDTEDWLGKKIILYEEPNVSFGGKLVGGIRVRALKVQTAPKVLEKKAKPVDDY